MKNSTLLLTVGLLAVLCSSGCKSTGATPPNTELTLEYRETQGELQRQQTELAVTGATLEAESRDLVEDITRLETSLSAVPADHGEGDRQAWLTQVQTLRAKAEAHQGETETLNRQLAAERETSGALARKFDALEAVYGQALAERERENGILRGNLQKVTGQRNTLLAIIGTAAAVIILFVVFKVLRLMRVIPI